MSAHENEHPVHGFTRLGQAVHKRTVDHLPTDSAYQRLNKSVAIALTKYVGTMTCFWVFCLLALFSLPAVLSGFWRPMLELQRHSRTSKMRATASNKPSRSWTYIPKEEIKVLLDAIESLRPSQ